MEFNAFQSESRRTINLALSDHERLVDAAAGLAEEAGEVLGCIRKHVYQQHPLDRQSLASELGDALWCLSTLATCLGVPLGDVATENLEKLRRRYPDGFSPRASRERDG